MDDVEKGIIAVLSRYPEGLGYRELHKKLKDERGRDLCAFLTLQRRIDKLSREGYVEIVEKEWRRGKKKIVRLKDPYKIIADKLSEIRAFKNAFIKYLEGNLRDLTSKDAFEALMTLNKIELAKVVLRDKLRMKRYELLNLDLSLNFKKELVFETFEVEKEIENEVIDKISDIKPIYDLYRAYLRTLQELMAEKDSPEFLDKILNLDKIFEKNLSLINKELCEKLREEIEEIRERKEEKAKVGKYAEEERKKEIKEILIDIEKNPEKYIDIIKNILEFAFIAPEIGKLTEEIAVATDPYSVYQRLKSFRSEIEFEIENLVKEMIEK